MRPKKREMGEVLSPSCLPTVQVLPFHEPLQIRMVVPDVTLVLGSFQVMAPLLQGVNDREHFFVRHQVVSFFRAHGMRREGDGMPLVVLLDGEDHTGCKVRGVCFEPELTIVVWVSEDGSGGEGGLQTCECVGFCAAPSEGLVFLCEICEGFCQCGIVFNKTSVEVG